MKVDDDSLVGHAASVAAWPLMGLVVKKSCCFTRDPDNDVDGRTDAASLLCNQCAISNGAADHPTLEALS
jgi:hypothetical protein